MTRAIDELDKLFPIGLEMVVPACTSIPTNFDIVKRITLMGADTAKADNPGPLSIIDDIDLVIIRRVK